MSPLNLRPLPTAGEVNSNSVRPKFRLALSSRERSEPPSLPQAVLGEGQARSARERAAAPGEHPREGPRGSLAEPPIVADARLRVALVHFSRLARGGTARARSLRIRAIEICTPVS